MKIKTGAITLICAAVLSGGCSTRHEVAVAPMEVKPIHITIDVNVKVDRALDNFFDEIDEVEQQIDPQSENE